MNHIIHNPTWGFPLSEPAHLRFAPETLAHLGERLVPGAEQAIIELVKNALSTIAEEMGLTVVRSAYSSQVKEGGDSTAAIFDHFGRLVAQSVGSPPSSPWLYRMLAYCASGPIPGPLKARRNRPSSVMGV